MELLVWVLLCRQTSPMFSPSHFKTGTWFCLMFELLFLYLPTALALVEVTQSTCLNVLI